MSVKQMGIVWELDLPHDEKFVLLACADEGDGWASRRRIARKTGYSEKQVMRIVRKLIERGLMKPVASGDRRGNIPEYFLTLED